MSSADREASPIIDLIAKEIALGRMGNRPDRETARAIEKLMERKK